MTEELSFEAYLSLSQNKFQIYLLDKKSLKNIYKEEVYLENTSDLIDYNLLHSFLDKNIFKIEKLIGKFLRSIIVVIDNNQTLNCSIGIKKKNYGEKIDKNNLESSLAELKDLFKENYQNYKIMHFVINRCLIDGINYTSFDKEIIGEDMIIEVNFISISNILIKEISNVLEKYQIKIDRLFEKKYIKNLFEGEHLDLSLIAFKIQSGHNKNEITLVPKSIKKRGFFEKFFQLFS
ncbi:MAG: hypothetical protein ACJZ4Y_00995 [Candidatus Pelagibacter sp.]|jgi:hypothetical protein|tara:strand:- start:39 stop:743 length:705 start_codon:yes stop_codon:yes gene_type:complete